MGKLIEIETFHQQAADWIGTIRAIHRERLGREPTDRELDDHLCWIVSPPLGSTQWHAEEITAFVMGLDEYKNRQPPTPQPPAFLERLHCEGTRFLTESGQPFYWRGATWFRGFQRFCAGEDVRPGLRWAKALGVNVLRVLGMFNGNIGRFIPAEQPSYFGLLDEYFLLLAEEDLRGEFTIFADAQRIMTDVTAQRRFVDQVSQVLCLHPNTFEEIGNEYPQNGFKPEDFHKVDGILTSMGSGLGDGPPALGGDYLTLHSRRGVDWWCRAPEGSLQDPNVKNNPKGSDWYGFPYPPPNVPIVLDEPMGAGIEGKDGRDNTPWKHFAFHASAAACRLAGSTLHGDSLINAVVPTGRELACYEAGARGWAVSLLRPQ